MTRSIGKAPSGTKRRQSTSKKMVEEQNLILSETSIPVEEMPVEEDKEQPAKFAGSSPTDLNSQDYPLHPERIWPD